MVKKPPYTILTIYVNLDPLPGLFHTPESARRTVEGVLKTLIPHYSPKVYLATDPVAMETLNGDSE